MSPPHLAIGAEGDRALTGGPVLRGLALLHEAVPPAIRLVQLLQN